VKNKIYTFFIFLILLTFLTGCSGNNRGKLNTIPQKQLKSIKPVVSPLPPKDDIIKSTLPTLPDVFNTGEKIKIVSFAEQKTYNLSLKSSDIQSILLALVKNTEIGLIVDAGISGTIPVMDLKNATLKEVLNYILPPLKLKYEWKGKNIHIYKEPLLTRYFKFNYLSAGRTGSRQVAFSTRSGGSNGSSGSSSGSSSSGSNNGSSGGSSSGGSGNQSTNEIKVDYKNTIWHTFIESLKVLVFGTLENANASTKTISGGDAEVPTSFAFSDNSGKILIVSPETGIVMMKSFKNDINKVAKFIEKFEGSAQRQVWIEAKIMEVNLNKGYQMGIDWGSLINRNKHYGTLSGKRTLPSQTLSFTPGVISDQGMQSGTAGAFQFAISNNIVDFVIDAISKQGNLKVLASPRVSTLNNEKAVIRVVREEVYFSLETQVSQGVSGNVTAPTINVQVVPIGIVMDIIPQIGDNGEIILSINPDISELLEVKQFSVAGATSMQPVIDRRSIDTIAKIKDGQTLVIAGIIKERKNEVIKGVPFLYKLPIIGNLFRRTEQTIDKTELVILITPHIVSGKIGDELTDNEIERIRRASIPLHLGDVSGTKSGMRGEFYQYKTGMINNKNTTKK
jgi:MSHA type pilus biogenesis protein MshL